MAAAGGRTSAAIPSGADLTASLAALPLSERKRRYVHDSLQPSLEPMLAELLRTRPADPEAFMIEWLRARQQSGGSMRAEGS
mmetsp:Transcript_19461/g.45676  ORF Transcript_19461/g.45676 Transcript_19461/m.45676 type:complete len:82 (+) Transcript_19461:56-301(+)|eukprot:CAMPEP_0171106480 /NCGR_PEP_ID=MMETSP0766_2-20121228/64828_1 /TAXON_ID=439317 /ORGANISM="Gambierdiscus australes, Strain CAWD 149" /LENGTH=81 /DNA_ID=CAMNT_0011567569 /DNA_START=50 /DNA_END=295 /DNA_ORIENTATION=+